MAKKVTDKTKTTKSSSGVKSSPVGSAPAEAVISTAKAAKSQQRAAKQALKATAKPKKQKVVHPKAKITFRHNFVPPILGILMFLSVLGLLNAQWVQAQYQYRFGTPGANPLYIKSEQSIDPNAPAHIYIPDINVDAPIVTDVKTYDPSGVQLALRNGTLQYGNSANPGEKGNVVVIGHSSGQLWAPGNYKFVFTLLDKMEVNQRIFIDYKGQRYIYRVSKTKVVPPTDISVLQHSDEPQLTLITCTPVGTSKNRRVIIARQVSPNPATAKVIETKAITTMTIPN